jgi:AI-2 transport protein TqsA
MSLDHQDAKPWIKLAALLMLIWTLRMASTVVVPVAVAVFIVILVWPLQVRLEQRLPHSASTVLTVVAMVLVFALLGALIWICIGEIVSKTSQYRRLFESFIGKLDTTLSRYRLHGAALHIDPEKVVGQAVSLVGTFAVGTYQFVGFAVMVIVLVVLSLIEVRPLTLRLKAWIAPEHAEKLMAAVRNIAISIQRFMMTRTLTSAITGVLTGLYTWIEGLDFPLVWGVLAFCLNYIPVLGSVVAVIPPTVVALIQPGSSWLAVATLGGLTVIQMAVGNYLDPVLQGRYLSLPPVVVFYAIVFWGWLWGIPGAVLGVPLTVGLGITCQHFESTRWLARLLLSGPERRGP